MAQVRSNSAPPALSGKLAKLLGCGANAQEKNLNYCESALKEVYEILVSKQNGFGLAQFKQLVTIFDEHLENDTLPEAFQILSKANSCNIANATITLAQFENWFNSEAESTVQISDEEIKRDDTRQRKITELFHKRNIFSALRLWKEIHEDYEEEFKEDLNPTAKTVAKRKLAIIHAKMHIPTCVTRALEQLTKAAECPSKRNSKSHF